MSANTAREIEGEERDRTRRPMARMIVGDGAAVAFDGTTRRVRLYSETDPAPSTLGDVLRLADTAGASLVWIDAHSELRARISEDVASFCSEADGAELARLPQDADTGDIFAWQRIERTGKPRVTVAYPVPNDPKSYLWTAPSDTGEGDETPEAQAERFTHDLRGVYYAARALDYTLGATPSKTGRSLAAHLNARRGWYVPAQGDYRAVVPDAHAAPAAALGWRRPLTEDERELLASGRAWLHAFDKRAAYLAASGGLNLPLGEPRYRDGGTFGKAERQRPALWHVRLTWPTGTPWNGRELPLIDAAGNGAACWLWTPELGFASRMGASIEVLGAIAWPSEEAHQILNTWKARLWAARVAVSSETFDETGRYAADEIARKWAADAIKSVYTCTIGIFRFHEGEGETAEETGGDREPERWKHPEWGALIQSEAAARMYAHLDALYRAGLRPLYTHIDTFTLLTDSATPPQLPEALKRDAAVCGSFRHEWSAPGSEIASYLLSPISGTYTPEGKTHGHSIPSIRNR